MNKQKALHVSLVFLFSFLLLDFLTAEEKQLVTVGYSESIRTVVTDINSFNNKGYGYEVFKKIEEVSNLRFEFVPIQGSLIDAVKNGEVDVSGFNIKTPAREKEVLFSNIQYSKTSAALATKKDAVYYNDFQEINGKTVATYPDNLAQTYLDRYCNFYNISVEYVYGTIENYMQLDTDFYITYSQHQEASGKNNVLNLGVYGIYLNASFENKELLQKLDTIFYDVVATEGNFFLELEEKYLADNIELNHRSLSASEVQTLRQKPLEVGYIADYAPISFTNEEGQPDGAMIETLNLFANRYGFQVNYHPYSLTDNQEDHDYYDILVTLYGDGKNDLQYYIATEPYYSIPMYAQVHKDIYNSSLTTREIIERSPKIGMLQYHTVDYEIFLRAFPNTEVIFYTDWHELLDAFSTKEIDILISTESSTTYAELYLSDDDRVTVHTDLDVPMQFYISKNIADEYVKVFNVMLDNVSESEYSGILRNNSNNFIPKATLADFILENMLFFITILLFIVILFLVFGYQQRIKRKMRVAEAYNTDLLTGLIALHKFTEIFEATLKTAHAGEYELISLDIDMFKTINTHYSNERGTNAILAISNALMKAFKGTDAVITRRTADQFIILRKINEGGEIQYVYENYILPLIRTSIGEKYNIAMSFGSVVIENCKEKSSAIMGHADSARLLGKNQHTTTYITFDEKMKKAYENKINVTFKMERALSSKEFVVVYQPKINFDTLQVGGAEALVRWRPKGENQIFPDAFIPVFEENGFIFYLDMFVLEEVCCFIKNYESIIDFPSISVNLSTYTILSEKALLTIDKIISRYNIPPTKIEFEITESAIAFDETKLLANVKLLKDRGFNIAIDDFGAGVSSLNRLSTISADILKLDKAFFSLTNTAGVKSNIIISDVINMAKHLNMLVVAEGVETLDQAIWLKGINCDYAQGYYFERPLEKDVFIELLHADKTYDINY